MSPIDAESQIRFLTNIQRLLDEGKFTASYKYALLLALVDLAVEIGDDSDRELEISTVKIAEKFIQYYWRQARPYPQSEGRWAILRQNTGKPATVISLISKTQKEIAETVAHVRSDRIVWHGLVKSVDHTVREMPLPRLQTIGGQQADFLYEAPGNGLSIRLRPGAAFCFRKFHGLISDLIRGAWLRYVRQTNQSILGTTADLSEFLFGAERSQLGAVRSVLRDLQRGECFYCQKPITASGHVDHFIPWARYPVDLGHNFVLAHAACNSAKGDRIASCRHLDRWVQRNLDEGPRLDQVLCERDVVCDLATSWRISHWAYRNTESANGLVWDNRDVMVPLDQGWDRELLRLLPSASWDSA